MHHTWRKQLDNFTSSKQRGALKAPFHSRVNHYTEKLSSVRLFCLQHLALCSLTYCCTSDVSCQTVLWISWVHSLYMWRHSFIILSNTVLQVKKFGFTVGKLDWITWHVTRQILVLITLVMNNWDNITLAFANNLLVDLLAELISC